MFERDQVVRLLNAVKRLAVGVSLIYGLTLLVVMTVVLGGALGGALLSYVVALALTGALSVLVLYVVVSSVSQGATTTVDDGAYAGARSSKYAA